MSNALEAKAIPEDIKRDAVNALQVAKNRRHTIASILSDALIIEAIEEALCAERGRVQRDPIIRIRPHLRDCQFCKAKGSDSETVLFTAETDVIDQFEYGYTIRCTGCGVELHDEYEDEVIRLWNGEDRLVEEDGE